jgi:hypothetical protein
MLTHPPALSETGTETPPANRNDALINIPEGNRFNALKTKSCETSWKDHLHKSPQMIFSTPPHLI